ncbi:MAG: LysM peptidoglycan-binding domain-containing protein [Clostridia bacterium]|nr:LysM peptidoglycan-binding domain-containing protein [Clostridia bacterium]
MLNTVYREFYQVKKGQTLKEIADYFSVSEWLLASTNGLSAPPFAGQILAIPKEQGNAYTVQEGDTKALLCGNEENYRRKNGTDVFYIGMRVRI